ncbi:unnamed protein product [Bursaphelenchus xylophilus]|uniref:(pine wood nematode) hypothetical protein n=1 Tax=Bursaphelenchus xylophilus TaxID=6326 RepID=A0A1I7SWA2_BURXY|nr:unnamed protein product [Bursaphelenchus xylophilus]CAG9099077.1 unnamed protein product [Bursaphelenchus xylophilus]
MLPLDISITFYHKCLVDEKRIMNMTHNEASDLNCEEPKGYLKEDFLLHVWRIVYWSSQLLTWILLPIMQSYTKGGSFTAMGRLKFALYNNIIYYTMYLVLFVFLLIYAISKGVSMNLDHLKVLIISASNTWGFLFLVVLLGYGLVEVPRKLWEAGLKERRLQRTYFEVEKLASEKSEAEETVHQLYHECREVLNLLKNERGQSREQIQEVIKQFPDEIANKVANSRQVAFSSPHLKNMDAKTASEESFLVRLNRRTNLAVQNYRRTHAQWKALLEEACYLEDVIVAQEKRKLPDWNRDKWIKRYLNERVLFNWHTRGKEVMIRVLAVICLAMTILILWSECTFFIVKPQLSLAARILHSMALGYHYKYIQVTAVGLILYLSLCAYYTVFHLKIYKYYHLDPHQMTDPNSMVFSAMLLCRLTPPLCLNFLGMVHLDTHITARTDFGVETQFTRLMGHLDVIPVLASGINIYLPMLIVILCLSTWLKLGTRAMHAIGIDQFMDEDEMTADMIQSGKALVSLERRSNGAFKEPARMEGQREERTFRNKAFKNDDEDRVPLVESGNEDMFDQPYEPVNLFDLSSERPPTHPHSNDIFNDL